MKRTALQRTALLLALAIAGSANSSDTVPYPENFRSWSHVKSGVIGPQHQNFASLGGLHHVYANKEAMAGYRTRQFPEQSVIVFEWLLARPGQNLPLDEFAGPER